MAFNDNNNNETGKGSKTGEEQKDQTIIDLNEELAKKRKEEQKDPADSEGQSTPNIESLGQMLEELKKQVSPLAKNLKDLVELANKKPEAAKEHNEINEEVSEASQSPAEEAKDETGLGESAEVVSLALERFKRRGVNKNVDIKEIFSKQFEQFVDTELKDEEIATNAEGKKVVKIDADFLSNHGKQLVPSLLGGVVQSFLGSVFGEGLFPDATKDENASSNEAKSETPAENVKDEGEAEATAQDESEVEDQKQREPKYAVKFDLGKIIKQFIENAQPVNPPQTPKELAESEKARQALLQATDVFEDTLNGEATLEDVAAVLNDEDSSKEKEPSPEEIAPTDEKHAKILKIAKEFERSVENPDEKN